MKRSSQLKRSAWIRKPKLKPRQKPKKAPRSLAKLKKDLDTVFSLFIRNKYSKNGLCYCYTCGKPIPIKKAHCGHFISRSYLATRWDLDNCRPQDVGCNFFGGGKPLDFEENLVNEIGQERVDTLKKRRHEIWKLDRTWFNENIAKYKALLKDQ